MGPPLAPLENSMSLRQDQALQDGLNAEEQNQFYFVTLLMPYILH
jgi:hypothetical protein